MRVRYDPEVDALRITTDTLGVVSASLWDPEYHSVVVDLATEDGYGIVGLEVLGASAFIPLGKLGYDAETDTLTMGNTTTDPELITENGDLIGYWRVDEHEPDGYRDPIGVAIRRASIHLAKVSEKMSAILVNAD